MRDQTVPSPLGMMLIGYSREEAISVKDGLMRVVGQDIQVIDASGEWGRSVSEVLDSGGADLFERKERAILMFLGFDDGQISSSIDNFPKGPDLRRPIFCSLTEENVNWSLDHLVSDLLEEDRYWKEVRAREKS